MQILKTLIAIAVVVLLQSGCASSKQVVPELPVVELYDNAQTMLQKGDFHGAITQLEALDNRYPYGPHAQQVQLDLICAYYKASEWALAQTMSARFMRLNVTHPSIDYVLYLRGLTNLSFEDNLLQRWCKIDRADRDNILVRQAFCDFKRLVVHHPSSRYAMDAWVRLAGIKNYLARHDLAVAKYYHQRDAHVAVVNRVVQMLRDYPDTSATRQALPLLQNAYQQLSLVQSAAKVEQLIRANASL